MWKFKSLVTSALSLLILAACQVTTPPVNVNVPSGTGATTSGSGALSCSLSLASGTGVSSGQAIPITVTVSGGSGPYTVSGALGTFLSSISLSRTYTNNGSGVITQIDTLSVSDSIGSTASCSLSIPVNPVVTSLACSVAASTNAPQVGQTVNFTSTASGGTAPYTFTGFNAGVNGSLVSALSQGSATQASASASYSAAGVSTASFNLSDSAGHQTTCTSVENVTGTAAVSIIASPSTSVSAGSTISLTAQVSGFSGTPTYVFSTSSPGINLSYSGPYASVSSVDLTNRTGVINVSATYGSQVATNSITVSFVASQVLACSIAPVPAVYTVGNTVPFRITSSTGEALTVTVLNVEDGYLADSYLTASPNLVFYASGSKRVTARARSTSTGVLCNSGALLETSVFINPLASTLSCNLTLSSNPVSQDMHVTASVTSSGASGTVRMIDIYSTPYAAMDFHYWASDTSAKVSFPFVGSYQVTARIQDSSGRTATCSTYEVVNAATTSPICYWDPYYWIYVCY